MENQSRRYQRRTTRPYLESFERRDLLTTMHPLLSPLHSDPAPFVLLAPQTNEEAVSVLPRADQGSTGSDGNVAASASGTLSPDDSTIAVGVTVLNSDTTSNSSQNGPATVEASVGLATVDSVNLATDESGIVSQTVVVSVADLTTQTVQL